MKKICLLALAVLMLFGCSKGKKESTLMITRDEQLYALYNTSGDRLTDYKYKSYEEVSDIGYIVVNEEDQVGFINLKGKEVIPFGEYETLEAAGQMLYATAKVETKEETNEVKKTNDSDYMTDNLYVLNNKGKVLYTASEDTAILKSGLPVLLKNDEYTILYQDGEVLETTKEKVNFIDQYNNQQIVVCYDNQTVYYDFENGKDEPLTTTIEGKAQYKIMASDEISLKSTILYDKTTQNFVYVNRENQIIAQTKVKLTDVYYDEGGNIIIKNGNELMVYNAKNGPMKMNSCYQSSYTYLNRSDVIYGPHEIYKDGEVVGELENCQLYPAAQYVSSDIYPVYVKKTGFQYYNFDNELVIDKVYLEAEPFDSNSRAVVKIKEDGYSLIDETGKVVTSHYYTGIKYIGSSYYAVYNNEGKYGIINEKGEEIFQVEYTLLPEESFIRYDGKEYLILGKNGRCFVYDIEDKMNVIFSVEGEIVFDDRGFFVVDKEYYTFEGDRME